MIFALIRRYFYIFKHKCVYIDRRKNYGKKYVYLFSEGNASMRNLLGGKGANLAEMTNLGLPVPQGFTVTTEACTRYYQDGETINRRLLTKYEAMGKVEK